MTSLEELELWVYLGEWPREGPGQTNNINHEHMHSIRLQVKCSALSGTLRLSDASDWTFGVGDTWGYGGFEGQTDLPSCHLVAVW